MLLTSRWRAGPDGIRQKDGKRLELGTGADGLWFCARDGAHASGAAVGVDWKTQSVPYGDVVPLQAGSEGSVTLIPFFDSGSDPGTFCAILQE